MSLFNACLARNNARRARDAAAQPFQLCRLTQAGVPSKMHDAVSGYASEADALAYVIRVRNLNPASIMRFSLNSVEV